MNSCYPIKVKPLDDYKLYIIFDNGEHREFNVAPYLNDSFFAPLSNINIFKTVRINSISIEWDGDIDRVGFRGGEAEEEEGGPRREHLPV